MTAWAIAVIVVACILAFGGGVFVGYRIKHHITGSLLILHDDVEGEKYLSLEIGKHTVDDLYDGNEITLKVMEFLPNSRK